MTAPLTHYAVLGVPPDAPADAVVGAFRPRAARAHPDRGGDPEEWTRLATAYGTLRDPAKAAAYLSGLRAEVGACTACEGSGVRSAARGPRAPVVTSECAVCSGQGKVL